MNFKYINRLLLVLILFIVYSCEKLEDLTKKLEENIEELLNFNCSGRCYRKEITEDSLLSEIEKYSLDNGIFNHNFAKRYLDIDKVVDKFLE